MNEMFLFSFSLALKNKQTKVKQTNKKALQTTRRKH